MMMSTRLPLNSSVEPLLSPLMCITEHQSSSSIDGKMAYIDQSSFGSSFSFSRGGPRSEEESANDPRGENKFNKLLESLEDDRLDDVSPTNMDMFKTLLETLHGRLLLMEENVSYLRSEVEHKNTTIDQLIRVVNKLAPYSDSDTTYNNNVDVYNENVSKHNSTPVNKNVTTRKKTEPPDELAKSDLQRVPSVIITVVRR